MQRYDSFSFICIAVSLWYCNKEIILHSEASGKEQRMRHVFSWDSPLFSAVNRIAGVIAVNILFLLLCIPVFSSGTAAIALYETAASWRSASPLGVGGFLRAFRAELRRGTLLTLCLLPAVLLAACDVVYCVRVLAARQLWAAAALFLLPVAFVLLTAACVFPLAAHFSGGIKQTLHCAFSLVIVCFPRVLAACLLQLLPFALAVALPKLLPFLAVFDLLAGAALAAWCSDLLLAKAFSRVRTGSPDGR